jgi:hypothetical protein
MSTLIKSEIRTARKHHPCGAFYWFDRSNYGPQDVDPDDWMLVERVRLAGARITPGMRYKHQTTVDGGEFAEFKCRLDMHDICLKYNLYPED